ncbi:MAG: sulfite exporter TauE/SafE family protein [Actinomycetota bacterium]
MHLSMWEWAACLALVAFGATAQGVVGLGLNLHAVPLVAIIDPGAVPGAFVLMGIPLSAAIAVRERHEIDHAGLRWVIAMRIPGTVLGVVIVSLVSQSTLLVAVGIAIVLGVALLRFRAPAEITAGEAGAAGFAAGVMGTTAAVDGPPLALLYQQHAGPRLRATLAVAFIVGSVMSASALAIGGQLTWHQGVFAAAMLPAVGLGYAISHLIARRVHSTHLRTAVLALAFAAGIAAILRGLL